MSNIWIILFTITCTNHKKQIDQNKQHIAYYHFDKKQRRIDKIGIRDR